MIEIREEQVYVGEAYLRSMKRFHPWIYATDNVGRRYSFEGRAGSSGDDAEETLAMLTIKHPNRVYALGPRINFESLAANPRPIRPKEWIVPFSGYAPISLFVRLEKINV